MSVKRFCCFLLALLLLPVSAFAEPEDAIQSGDIVYLGEPDESVGFDGAWRVLDPAHTNTGEDGMLLLAEHLIGAGGIRFRDDPAPSTNRYAGSDAKAWCAAFFETHFSPAEQAAILPTFLSDPAFAIRAGFSDSEHAPMVNFDAVENILDGDRLFLLSAEEASSAAYGLDTDRARMAGQNGVSANWWLRSPHDPSFPIDVGIVFYNGWLLDFFENQDNAFFTAPIYMRPALNLDRSGLASVERVGDGEWVLHTEGTAHTYAYGVRQPLREPFLAAHLGTFLLAGLLLLAGGIVTLIVLHRRRKRRTARATAARSR